MKFKIRCVPEDFKVDEITSIVLKKRGSYAVYRLSKRGRNTLDALEELSRQMRIPFDAFGYGGRKDRHAVATQHISICKGPAKNLEVKGGRFEFVGFAQRPMGPDLIVKNRFSIVVRDLAAGEADEALSQASEAVRHGYPNYFDDQRFGSYDPLQGFIGEKVLKGHLNGALKILLTAPQESDDAAEVERKKKLFDAWKDWEACLSLARTNEEKTVFHLLKKKPGALLELLKNVSRNELSLYFSAYQAFIWNETVRRLLKEKEKGPWRGYPGAAGDYLFYEGLSDPGQAYFKKRDLPTMSAKTEMPDEDSRRIYAAILSENGIERPMFNKIQLRQAWFKTFDRAALARPDDFSSSKDEDELYRGRSKLTLTFSLPRGGYGTMFLKRIFSEREHPGGNG